MNVSASSPILSAISPLMKGMAYLAVDERDGVEDEEGDTRRYCIECCLKKGYAQYKTEKGEQILTFLESGISEHD